MTVERPCMKPGWLSESSICTRGKTTDDMQRSFFRLGGEERQDDSEVVLGTLVLKNGNDVA